MASMTFAGFPIAALDFYDDLELDNTKAFWEANKAVYLSAVAEPMKALTAELAEEFGEAKIFRPYRDVRFSHDKTPYKTQQGAYVRVAEGTGWYVAISAAGVVMGGGFYSGQTAQLARLRRGIDDDRRGGELQRIVTDLTQAGFTLGGEELKTAPRGFSVDHPRIGLLRHKSLVLGLDYGHENTIIHRPELVDEVRAKWRSLQPLMAWFEREFARPDES